MKKMTLDFYLPELNIGIECQGIQHFENGHFNDSSLEKIKERDAYKLKSCKENGIDIIYFSNIKNEMCISDKNDVIELIKIFESNG